jgi:hypothetical protein
MTPELAADLAAIQQPGMTASDAVRHAVRLIAQAHALVAAVEARQGVRPPAVSVAVSALYGGVEEGV